MPLIKQIIEEAEEMARTQRSIARRVRPALLEEETNPEFWSERMSVDEFRHKFGLDHLDGAEQCSPNEWLDRLRDELAYRAASTTRAIGFVQAARS